MAGLFEDIFSGGVSAAGILDQQSRIRDIGEQAVAGTSALADQIQQDTQFKPFSVASNTGNVAVQPDGSINATLSAPQQGIADTAAGAAQGLFSQAAQDPAARQQQMFESILAGITPQQNRDRLALEGRLQSQGRSGINSAQFGGSPEQFALAKAQEEARIGAFNQAQQLGLQEQSQQASLADLFSNASLRPDAQLFNRINPAIQTAQLGQTGQIAGANQAAQLGLGGLEAQINAEKVAAELAGDLYGIGANAAGSFGRAVDDTGQGLFSGAGQVISDLFF